MTERAVDIPIRSVTLLEDRAQVTRKATLQLPAGVSRLAVEGVSPILADKTLVGRISGNAARVVDAPRAAEASHPGGGATPRGWCARRRCS